MEKFIKIIWLLIVILIILLGVNGFQWVKNKELAKMAGKLKEKTDFLIKENEQLSKENEQLSKEMKDLKKTIEELTTKYEELKRAIEKFIESRQYTNVKYGFEIKYFTDKSPYIIHDWTLNRHPNMPRRLWDASFFDSNYGKTFDRRTGIPVINITINECLPGENIDDCLSVATSPCGTVPYGEIKEIYKEEGKFETSPVFSFLDSPAKRLKISCSGTEEGIAIFKKSRLYTILFLTSSKDYMPVPKELGELMLSTFKFSE